MIEGSCRYSIAIQCAGVQQNVKFECIDCIHACIHCKLECNHPNQCNCMSQNRPAFGIKHTSHFYTFNHFWYLHSSFLLAEFYILCPSALQPEAQSENGKRKQRREKKAEQLVWIAWMQILSWNWANAKYIFFKWKHYIWVKQINHKIKQIYFRHQINILISVYPVLVLKK